MAALQPFDFGRVGLFAETIVQHLDGGIDLVAGHPDLQPIEFGEGDP